MDHEKKSNFKCWLGNTKNKWGNPRWKLNVRDAPPAGINIRCTTSVGLPSARDPFARTHFVPKFIDKFRFTRRIPLERAYPTRDAVPCVIGDCDTTYMRERLGTPPFRKTWWVDGWESAAPCIRRKIRRKMRGASQNCRRSLHHGFLRQFEGDFPWMTLRSSPHLLSRVSLSFSREGERSPLSG